MKAAGAMTPARLGVLALWSIAVLAGLTLLAAFIQNEYWLGSDAAFTLFVMIVVADAIVFASVGALIVFRRPTNRIGWLLASIGPVLSMTFAGYAIGAVRTTNLGPEDVLAGFLSLLGGFGFYSLFFLLALTATLFPDGRFLSRRWRLAMALVAAPLVVAAPLALVKPGPVEVGLANNPLGIQLDAIVQLCRVLLPLATIAVPALLLLGAAAVLVRFRRADGDTREQLKWLLAAVALVAVLVAVSVTQPSEGMSPSAVAGLASLALLPISIGIAVLRYRLYEIDRLISRTIGWAIVTGLLVTTFVVGLIGLQAILTSVTNTQGETLAVAASTLITLALFQPVRQRVQRAVDRRFDRTRYDGERVVEAFAGRLRDQFDLDVLATEVGRVAAETVRPTMAVVWLRPTTRAHP